MLVLGAVVDTAALLKVVWASLAAGLGVTATFAISILGGTMLAEMQREGRLAAMVGWGVVLTAGLAASAGAVAVGLVVMTSK
jgi:hypothetical protein